MDKTPPAGLTVFGIKVIQRHATITWMKSRGYVFLTGKVAAFDVPTTPEGFGP